MILNTYVTFNIHNMRLNCCVDCDDYEEDSCTKDHLLINFRKRDTNAKDVKQLRGLSCQLKTMKLYRLYKGSYINNVQFLGKGGQSLWD